MRRPLIGRVSELNSVSRVIESSQDREKISIALSGIGGIG